MATPLIVADTVLHPAVVELRLPVATPLVPVVLAGWVTVFPEPVAASTTVTPPAVAETAFVPATVELSVPVATPLELVGPAGWVSVLPEPVAVSVTVAPLTGFPLASRAVTVIVEVPLPAVIVVPYASAPALTEIEPGPTCA